MRKRVIGMRARWFGWDRPYGEKKRRGGEHGTSAVEFALVATVLFFLLLGIIEIGRALYLQHAVNAAAHEVARAIAGTPDLTQGELKQIVAVRAPALDASKVTIQVGKDSEHRRITVTVSYPFEPIVPFIVPIRNTLSATVHFRY